MCQSFALSDYKVKSHAPALHSGN